MKHMTTLSNTTKPSHDLVKENELLRDQVKKLTEDLAWFKRQIFGSRSEKIVSSNSQELFLDLKIPPPPPPQKKEVSAHQRSASKKHSTRLNFPDDLPLVQIIVDLKEDEKICSETGKLLVKIGEDVCQKLAHKPGSFFIKEIIRPKYAAFSEGEKTIISADLPDSILPGSKVDESFLAEILVRKFADHLPLYRQSEIFSREGIYVSRQLLSNWVVKAGLALQPLYDRMSQLILESNNVFMDEVPVDMLSPGKGSTHQAYMWVIVGGEGANPSYRVYHFRTNRRHIHAEEILKNYHGVIHSDKYGAYEKLAHRKQFVWCPCWAHIRRKFFDAEAGDPKFRKYVLRKIRHLFMYERVAWSCSEEERIRIRIEKEVPIIDELIASTKDKLMHGKALEKSKFKEALGYFCSLIPYLKNYIENPYARMDNNVAERAVRPLALGRKNWLFLGNEEGGNAAAVILSLVQTCRALKINPREYLEDVMRRLMSHSHQKIDELLPDQWIKAKSQST